MVGSVRPCDSYIRWDLCMTTYSEEDGSDGSNVEASAHVGDPGLMDTMDAVSKAFNSA